MFSATSGAHGEHTAWPIMCTVAIRTYTKHDAHVDHEAGSFNLADLAFWSSALFDLLGGGLFQGGSDSPLDLLFTEQVHQALNELWLACNIIQIKI
jgi:hypothetical protein